MDLIYTDGQRVDLGVLKAYALDLSFGEEENSFELTLGAGEPELEPGMCVYLEGTEYGGLIDGKTLRSDTSTVVYAGRTWHGVLDSRVLEPDAGADHFIFPAGLGSGDALATLIARCGLGDLFEADDEAPTYALARHRFSRYCTIYAGMLELGRSQGMKLMMVYGSGGKVKLSFAPVADYSDEPLDGAGAVMVIEQVEGKVNHLVCLGRGELAEREVIHLFADETGAVVEEQRLWGLQERCAVYENVNSEDLRGDGTRKLREYQRAGGVTLDLDETERAYDIGDIVAARDERSGIEVARTISQKIVRARNGTISTEYRAG